MGVIILDASRSFWCFRLPLILLFPSLYFDYILSCHGSAVKQSSSYLFLLCHWVCVHVWIFTRLHRAHRDEIETSQFASALLLYTGTRPLFQRTMRQVQLTFRFWCGGCHIPCLCDAIASTLTHTPSFNQFTETDSKS